MPKLSKARKAIVATVLFAGSVLVFAGAVQEPAAPTKPAPQSATSTKSPITQQGSLRPVGFDPHAREFFRLIWGVDSLSVKSVESGEMIRFSYLVLDADKAKLLNDKKLNPVLLDERARASLVIPTLEKVGQLRQTSTPEAGRAYWMVFSNKGNVVKPGDLVSVVIGKFRVDRLVVQ
jgi:hypothetical protein